MGKRELIAEHIEAVRAFRFCGPSDDPDEQTAVTFAFRHIVIQLKRLAGPLLAEDDRRRLDELEVEGNNIYSAYDAHSEIVALLPDIEAALENCDDIPSTVTSKSIVDTQIIRCLELATSESFDFQLLARICKEINSCYFHGNIVATLLLMRAVLNYVPPVFRHSSFEQVVAHSGRSLKDSFTHLNEGLRKIADFHTHRRIGSRDLYPTIAQVEPFKPQFEQLLHEVLSCNGT